MSVFTLTQICYDSGVEYSQLKVLVPYLQRVLVNSNSSEDESFCECVMGLDSILLAGANEGTHDFMSFDQVQELLKKLISFYSENLKMLLVIETMPEYKDNYHHTYPSMDMISQLFINILDESNENVSGYFERLEFIPLLQESFHILLCVSRSTYWENSFRQLIVMTTKFIATGPNAACMILKGTQLIEQMIQNVVITTDAHGHIMTNRIFHDFMSLA